MRSETFTVGLTGGIAAGKSEVQRILLEQNVPVLDTDHVAHEVMRPGEAAYDKVVEAFGKGILSSTGDIDRRVLGKIVFDHPAERQKLNGLVHPEVGKRWRAWLGAQSGPLAVVSIPLLFECGLQTSFDGVLCVWAPESQMKKRLMTRGLTGLEATQRIQSQWPVDAKRKQSTWTLVNDRHVEDLEREVLNWLKRFIPNPR